MSNNGRHYLLRQLLEKWICKVARGLCPWCVELSLSSLSSSQNPHAHIFSVAALLCGNTQHAHTHTSVFSFTLLLSFYSNGKLCVTNVPYSLFRTFFSCVGMWRPFLAIPYQKFRNGNGVKTIYTTGTHHDIATGNTLIGVCRRIIIRTHVY